MPRDHCLVIKRPERDYNHWTPSGTGLRINRAIGGIVLVQMGIISKGIMFNNIHLIYIVFYLTILLALPSKAWVCGRCRAGIAGSNRDGPITRPEKSNRVWYVFVLHTSTMWRLRPIRVIEPRKKNYILFKESKSFMACTGTALLQYGNRWPSDCISIKYLLRTVSC